MIIIGLGNPGQHYLSTRHNVGFAVIDRVAKTSNADWTSERGVMFAKVGPHLLIKPQQFMNVSGPAVADYFQYKHIPLPTNPSDLVVIHDDLDFAPGAWQCQVDRSAAGHNGVQSIIDALGTQNFTRYRIGIGNNREFNIPAEEYVLQQPTATDQPLIDHAIATIVAQLSETLK